MRPDRAMLLAPHAALAAVVCMGCCGRQALPSNASNTRTPVNGGANVAQTVQAPPHQQVSAAGAKTNSDGYWTDQPRHDERQRCREMLQAARRDTATVDDASTAMARTALVGCRGPGEPGCQTCCQQSSGQCTQRQSSRPIEGVVTEPDFYNLSIGIGACCPKNCPQCDACGLLEEARARDAIEKLAACNCELTPEPLDPCWGGGCDCAWNEIESHSYRECPHLFGGWRPNHNDHDDP